MIEPTLERFDLMCVVKWLEAGCDPKEAAKELRGYQPKLAALLSRLDKAEESVEIMTALTRTPLYSHRALAERLSQIMGARFGARFMDPPDGGDVPIHEQVERMADALLAAERPSES